MKAKTLPTLVILLLNASLLSNLRAQVTTYQKTFGGAGYDGGNCLIGMSDNGFVIAGETKSFADTSGDTYLIKVDARGDTEWTQQYGGAWLDGGNSIASTGDGYFLTDHTTSFGAGECDSYVFKVDLNGVKQWGHTFGYALNDAGYQGIQTRTGQYIITGLSEPPANPGGEVFVAKYDVDGTPLWAKLYGTGEGYRIVQTPDGNFVIAGISTGDPNGANNDIIIFKIDGNGNQLWYHTIPGDGNSAPYGFINTSDSDLLISGYVTGYTDNWDALLIKLNSDGNVIWRKTYAKSGNDRAYSVVETGDGYIFAGETQSVTNGDLDVLVAKTDKAGNQLWWKSYGGPQQDFARWIAPCADGGFGIVGNTTSFGAGDNDVYLIKIDDSGNAPTGVNEVSESVAQFSVFPNPAHTSFTIKASNYMGTARMSLFDITGNAVEQNAPLTGASCTFSATGLSAGMYFYSITNEGGKVIDRGKLVVN